MKLALIVAVSDNGTIGDRGRIPWHLREDLQRFKRLTMGHPVIMGRKTWESIGKPLPGRANLVLTRRGLTAASPEVGQFASLDHALAHCRARQVPLVFAIGGAEVYRAALPLADQLLMTEIHQCIDGDTRFPEWNRSQWLETYREDHTKFSFVEYARRPH